jgi:hypothetical protein
MEDLVFYLMNPQLHYSAFVYDWMELTSRLFGPREMEKLGSKVRGNIKHIKS